MGALKSERCSKGHPMVEGNLYHRSDGQRECLTCKRNRNRKIAAIAQVEERKPSKFDVVGSSPTGRSKVAKLPSGMPKDRGEAGHEGRIERGLVGTQADPLPKSISGIGVDGHAQSAGSYPHLASRTISTVAKTDAEQVSSPASPKKITIEVMNAKTSSGSKAAVELPEDARVSISELRSIAAGVRENLDRSIHVSVSTAQPVEEEERVMCPYTEYDSETGEMYGCRLPEHSVKIKHQRGPAL